MYEFLANGMQVTDNLGVTHQNVSRVVSMTGFNTAQIELTVFNDPGGQLVQVELHQSNDGENWSLAGTRGPFGQGYALLQAYTGIKAQYVRARLYFADVPNPTIVAFGINRSVQ